MKYCTHCGHENNDENEFCTSCGKEFEKSTNNGPIYRTYTTTVAEQQTLETIIKVLMVIACCCVGWTLIALAWMIPMTVHVFRCFNEKRPISVGFKVCTIIFMAVLPGILLLFHLEPVEISDNNQ